MNIKTIYKNMIYFINNNKETFENNEKQFIKIFTLRFFF